MNSKELITFFIEKKNYIQTLRDFNFILKVEKFHTKPIIENFIFFFRKFSNLLSCHRFSRQRWRWIWECECMINGIKRGLWCFILLFVSFFTVIFFYSILLMIIKWKWQLISYRTKIGACYPKSLAASFLLLMKKQMTFVFWMKWKKSQSSISQIIRFETCEIYSVNLFHWK